jgi:fatty-acid desaturase
MDWETLALAAGFDGYLIALALVLRSDIVRFGRTMVVGVFMGFVALVAGEIAVLGNRSEFGATMTLASIVAIGLIIHALWSHRALLSEPAYKEQD